jgi:hypothetical protein
MGRCTVFDGDGMHIIENGVTTFSKGKAMKPLFDEKYRTYNNDGRELSHKTEKALKDIISDINKKELNIYEAENIMMSTVNIMFCELRLTHSSDIIKKEKSQW